MLLVLLFFSIFKDILASSFQLKSSPEKIKTSSSTNDFGKASSEKIEILMSQSLPNDSTGPKVFSVKNLVDENSLTYLANSKSFSSKTNPLLLLKFGKIPSNNSDSKSNEGGAVSDKKAEAEGEKKSESESESESEAEEAENKYEDDEKEELMFELDDN